MRVICFSEIQYLYVRTRKQQILSRFPSDWKILFLSTVVKGGRNNFRPARDGRITHICIPVFKNFPQRTLRILFSIPPVRFLWNAILLVWLKIVLQSTGFGGKDRVFYVSNIYYSAVLPFLNRSLLLYDCNDDPLAFPLTPRWAGRYFRKLVLSSDLMTAVSGGLVKFLEEAGGRNIRKIGNGVDVDIFERSASAGTPEEMKSLPRPVLGYVGAIGEWFDFDLVERIADEFVEGSLVLIGPVLAGMEERFASMTGSGRRIVHLGERPYDRLGSYLSAVDVCLVPLKVNRLRRFADPNKLYEYAASGRPAVTLRYSDDMAELEDLFYIADDAVQFIDMIKTALLEGSDGKALKEYARSRSWQRRADEMAALIEEGLAGTL